MYVHTVYCKQFLQILKRWFAINKVLFLFLLTIIYPRLRPRACWFCGKEQPISSLMDQTIEQSMSSLMDQTKEQRMSSLMDQTREQSMSSLMNENISMINYIEMGADRQN